jgi:hypothetical protein
VKVRIYVEGGPQAIDANGLRRFRSGFKRHFERVDTRLEAVEVVAPGSTEQTIKSYAQGWRQYSDHCRVALLVDSDSPVTANSPAEHLRTKLDSAHVPQDARTNVFLMVQCMESWLVTDATALKACFGARLRENDLPRNPDIEAVPKRDALDALAAAVKPTPAGQYHKIHHGAKILAELNPDTVAQRSRHARDLHTFLRNSVQILDRP